MAWAEDEQAHRPAAQPGTKPPSHSLYQHLIFPEPGLLPVLLLLSGEEESHLGCEEDLLPLCHLRPALHFFVVDNRVECKLGEANPRSLCPVKLCFCNAAPSVLIALVQKAGAKSLFALPSAPLIGAG